MEILADFDFSFDHEQILKQAHVQPGSTDAADILPLIESARDIGRPKAAYSVAYVNERDSDRVRIDGVWFNSRTLAHQLKSVERVFPVIATCGHELDQATQFRGDLLREFWWDLVKIQLLEAADTFLQDHLIRRFRLNKTAVLRPGSGDRSVWPIEQQVGLFTLLGNVEEGVGVRLTDSCLMVPNKTVSGILYPTKTDFRSCELCHREDCSLRLSPFNQSLWEEIQND